MTEIQKYKFICEIFKHHHILDDLLFEKQGCHKHHINPRSLYPELVNEKTNIVVLPPTLHWYAHKCLFNYYKDINDTEAIDKLQYEDTAKFISSHIAPSYKINLNDEIKTLIDECCETVFSEVMSREFKYDLCITGIHNGQYVGLDIPGIGGSDLRDVSPIDEEIIFNPNGVRICRSLTKSRKYQDMFNKISHFDCIDIKDFTCTSKDFAFYKFIKKYLTLKDKIISVKRKPIKTNDIFLSEEKLNYYYQILNHKNTSMQK